jgi:hypothetical protein
VHPEDQHLFVIGTVEDADMAAFGQVAGGAPEEIVLEFRRARVAEAEHPATLRVYPAHDVLDDPVLAGRVHRLEDEQHGVSVVGVEPALQLVHRLAVLGQHRAILIVRPVGRLHPGRPFVEVDRGAGAHPEIVGIDFLRKSPSASITAGGA